MRSKRGITLVSLVVTIIILIILAGVSINLTLGENGIVTMAKKARENIELAQVDEQTKLNNLYDEIAAEGGVSSNPSNEETTKLAEFKREIASTLTDMGIETEENADTSTIISNIRELAEASSKEQEPEFYTYGNTYTFLSDYKKVYVSLNRTTTAILSLNGIECTPIIAYTTSSSVQTQHLYELNNIKANDTISGTGSGIIIAFK